MHTDTQQREHQTYHVNRNKHPYGALYFRVRQQPILTLKQDERYSTLQIQTQWSFITAVSLSRTI